MINSNELTLQEISLGDFFQLAYLFNLEQKKVEKYNLNGTRGFFSYMRGLSLFGEMVFSSKDELRIYKRITREDPYIRTRYYAIDNTGLCIGYIYAPNDKGIQDYVNPPKDSYYGFCLDEHKQTYLYDCVALPNSGTEEKFNVVISLEEFRSKFLPLPNISNYFSGIVYYDTGTDYNRNHYGPTIYRGTTRSFYLPLIELIRGTLNIKGWQLQISPSFEKENISFVAVDNYKTRKHDNSTTYKGTISYDKFEIIEHSCIDETSEYNW